MATWKEIVLLIAAAQGILLSLALFTRSKQQDKSNIFLGIIIFVISLEVLNDWGIQAGYHNSKNAIPFWLLESYLLLPASLWFFVKYHADSSFRFHKKHLLLYLPALIEILVETFKTIQYKITGHRFDLLKITAWHFFTEIIPPLWMGAVLLFYGIKLYRFPGNSSNLMYRVRIYGVFAVLSLLTICWLAEVLFQLPVFSFVEVLLIVFLFALGYIGYARPSFFDISRSVKKKLPIKQSFTNYDDERESARLLALMEQQALYTRPGLTLEELARELDLPVRYVSYLISSRHATNFHHFINTWRVKEVIRKINDPAQKHKTLIALAFESGFNSKSTFNEVFKNHTGQTPSQYLK